jgi:hypothetical protein
MIKTTRSAWVISALIACGTATTILAADTAKPEPKPSWKISGDLEEACSCHAPCPCWFKALPSRMTCDGVQAVFITKGKYGKTPLDGLALATFAQSPEGKSMFESFGNWNFEDVYIDSRATEEQRAALKEIAAHIFAQGAKTREFHFVPITRTIQGAEHQITVGTAGTFSGHLLEGGYAGNPKISNVPLADPTHQQFLQGQSTKLTYHEGAQGWQYEHSNYMFNNFTVNRDEYAKYEADLTRKMEQAKQPR